MAAGGPGVVNLGINASGFISQINTLISQTQTYNTAIGQLNATFNQFNVTVNNSSGGLGNLNRQLNALAAMASIQGIASLYRQFENATKEAAEFSRSIGLIQTITSDANMSYNEWAEGIRKVSDELAMPLAETSAAAYDLLSNQVTKAADTFDVLRTAGNLANITNSSVTNSVNTLSNAINAYGYSARDSEMLSAKLFTTVNLGRVKLNEIANTSGRVYETGKALGVTFDEVNAGMIAITQTGVKTSTAMTLMTNVFTKLLKPTKDLQELYDKWGVTPQSLLSMEGLAGVIKKIDDETKGSATAVQKYFNEIRSAQGFQILKDQLDQFNNGLAEQKTALDRAAKAKEVYESTPGFKFQKEVQEYTNALTTGLKTDLLQAGMKVADFFGGVKTTMLSLFAGVAAGTAAFTAFNAVLAASSITAAQLGAVLATMWAPALAAVTAAAAISVLVKWYDEAKQLKNMFEDLGDHWREILEQNSKKEIDGITLSVQKTREAMQEKQSALLEVTTRARQELLKTADDLDRIGDRLKDNLKNALELALGSAKDGLRDLESRLSKAMGNVNSARKAQGDAKGEKDDSVYSYLMARDRAENGGANERQIMQKRLDQLNRDMARAAQKGDLEGYNNLHSKAAGIINEAATATDENGNLKYTGQMRAIIELDQQHLSYLNEIGRVNQRNADNLSRQKALMEAQVKEAEDAGKALLDLDVFDKKGKAQFGSQNEFDAERERRQQRYNDAIKAVQSNPNNQVSAFRGANFLESQRILNQRNREVQQSADQYFGNRRQRQGNVESLQKVDADEAAIYKVTEQSIKQIQRLADEAIAAIHGKNEATANYKSASGALLATADRPGTLFAGLFNAKPYQDKFTGMMQQLDKAVEAGDYKGAQAKLRDAEEFIRQLGTLDDEVMKTGPKDANGEIINKTARQSFGYLRAQIAAQQKASAGADFSLSAFNDQNTKAPAAMDAMAKSFEAWKQIGAGVDSAKVDSVVHSVSEGVSEITTTLLENLERLNQARKNLEVTAEYQATEDAGQRPTGTKSQGGFAGYYAAGGEPRGIDTTLVRMSPDEMIMNPQASARFKSQLTAMNQGVSPFSSHSPGHTTNVGDIHVNVQGGNTAAQTIKEIGAGIQRGIRLGTIPLGR